MIPKPQKRLPKTVAFIFTLVCVLLSGCQTLSEDMCDPADDAFLKSFQCRDQYANRQNNLKEEVRLAGISSSDKENQLAALQAKHKSLGLSLEKMQLQLNTKQLRIDEIRRSNRASEADLLRLQTEWQDIQQETSQLKLRRKNVQSEQQAGELTSQINQLLKREAELENLLLDLES